jgi:hypothetical protein
VTRLGGGSPCSHRFGTDPMRAHEPGHAVFANPMPPLHERVPDPRAAIGVTTLPVDRSDIHDERAIEGTPLALRPITPGVVAGGRDRDT